jgi:hypothetical protein
MPAHTHPIPQHAVSDAIRQDCDRALRRLDALIDERDDVLLRHVRRFVSHARALAAAEAHHAATSP